MTPPEHDYDDLLARALRAAAEQVEPAGDGLMRIRSRLAEPWLLRQARLMITESADLAWLIVGHLEPLLARAAAAASRSWAALRRSLGAARAVPLADRTGSRRARTGPALSWAAGLRTRALRTIRLPRYDAAHTRAGSQHFRLQLRFRPVLAVTLAVLLIVTGAYALSQIRGTVSEIGLISGAGAAPPAVSTRTVPGRAAHSATRHRHGPTRHQPADIRQVVPSSPKPSPSCQPTTAASSSPSPSASASPTPSATTTPSVNATPTPLPDASPTQTTAVPGGGTDATVAPSAPAHTSAGSGTSRTASSRSRDCQ